MTGHCDSCAGRGWKYLRLRRALFTVASNGEAEPRGRLRVECLTCRGTGVVVTEAA